jgi:two-component system chemotaxis sensor kinase CheA
MTSAVLAAVDVVRQMLATVEASGNEGEVDCTELIDALRWLIDRPGDGVASAADGRGSGGSPETLIEPTAAIAAPLELAPSPPFAAPLAKEDHHEPGTPSSSAEGTIRVNTLLLDKLVNLAGELVLARNQVLQYASGLQEATFLGAAQRLSLITSELQEGIMKTRMQPIGTIWNKFPRVVRDLALACGKQVRLEMVGEGTELDKTLIEAIRDPLTHVVRNAIDHGIETPEERIAAVSRSRDGCCCARRTRAAM